MEKELSEMTLEELWELFPIILKEHNPAYKEWYAIEKQNIIDAIGESTCKRISHIGSTAIDGMIAKPTVDILLEVELDCEITEVMNRLVVAGWNLMSQTIKPNMRLSYNKGYTKYGFAKKVFHLHVRHIGDCNEIYFRDYLRQHEEVVREYEVLKLGLLEKYKHNRDAYTEEKTEFVTKYTMLAKKEAGV